MAPLMGKKIGCNMDIVVVMPRRGASTPEIFSAFDSLPTPPPIDNDALLKALEAGDKSLVAKYMANHLQPVTASLNQGIEAAIEALKKSGAMAAMMTGSGSACFGLFENGDSALAAQDMLIRARDFKGVYKVRTVRDSIKLNRLLK